MHVFAGSLWLCARWFDCLSVCLFAGQCGRFMFVCYVLCACLFFLVPMCVVGCSVSRLYYCLSGVCLCVCLRVCLFAFLCG